jgi:hypothetical protein
MRADSFCFPALLPPIPRGESSSGSSWLGVTMLRPWIVLRVPRWILSQS